VRLVLDPGEHRARAGYWILGIKIQNLPDFLCQRVGREGLGKKIGRPIVGMGYMVPETSGAPEAEMTHRSRSCGKVSVIDFSRGVEVGLALADVGFGRVCQQFVEIPCAQLEGFEHFQRVLLDGIEVTLHAIACFREMLIVRDPCREYENRNRQHDRSRNQDPQWPECGCQLFSRCLFVPRGAALGLGDCDHGTGKDGGTEESILPAVVRLSKFSGMGLLSAMQRELFRRCSARDSAPAFDGDEFVATVTSAGRASWHATGDLVALDLAIGGGS